MLARLVEGGHERVQIVAVDPLGKPAKRLPAIDNRFESQHFTGVAIGLLVVHINNRDQVVQLPVRGGHGRFPGGALVQFTVRQQVVDEGTGVLRFKPRQAPTAMPSP